MSGPNQQTLEKTRRELYEIVGGNPEAEFWIGRCNVELKKFDEAITSFRAYVEHERKNMDGWDNLIEAYLTTGQHDAALSAVESQLQIDPNHTFALLHRGQALEGLNRCSEAVAAYEEVEKRSKGFFDALIGLGTCYNKLGRYDEALAKFKQANEAKVDQQKTYVGRGEAYEKLGRLEDAIKMYNYARQLDPADLPTTRRLSDSYGRLGNWEDQIETLKLLIQKGENDSGTLDALENACSKANRLSEYGRILEQFRLEDPSNVQLLIRLGKLRFEEGNYGEAQKYYERALQQDANIPEALRRMGELIERRGGDLGRATEYYYKACKAQPQSVDVCVGLARLYLDRGEVRLADQELTRIQSVGGSSAELKFQTARLHYAEGQFSEALRVAEGALALDPKAAGARVLRARILARTGPSALAATELEASIVLIPNEKSLYVDLADVYQQQEKWAELRDLGMRYLAKWPKEAEAIMYLAFACQQSGDPTGALQYYRTALDLAGVAGDPNRRAWAYNNYGVLLLAVPDYSAAIKSFTEAQTIDPADPNIVQNLGLALAAEGSIKEAEGQLKRLQDMGSPLAEKFAAYLDGQRRLRRSP